LLYDAEDVIIPTKENEEKIMPNIIIYGNYEESSTLISYAEFSPKHIFRHTDVYDTFLSYLYENAPQAVFILIDGATGMEGVIAVRNFHPQCPVVWISNDKGFGIQSYRLGCAFFAEKPLTKKKIEIAFERISQMLGDDVHVAANRFAHLDDRIVKRISCAPNANELISMAKKHGVTIKKQEAENYFHYLDNHKSEELDDNMLEEVSAGIDINRFKLFFDSLQ
jgi:two-component SAPR family response regulator